jgi:hypothetical protein
MQQFSISVQWRTGVAKGAEVCCGSLVKVEKKHEKTEE